MSDVNLIKDILKTMNCIGVLITDGKGVIINVDSNFDNYYGLPAEELINKDVYTLEKQGIFNPSSVAVVLKSGKEETVIQKLKSGQDVIVTAFPLYDDQGTITKVITFSRDISSYQKLLSLYEKQAKEIEYYNNVINEISYERAVIEDFDTKNGDFQKMLLMIQRIAKYDINLLLQGETGVGKTLIAKKIHKLSNYASGKFVEVNCAAIPDNLIESELFGYEKGAFTGAHTQGKSGLFEVANGGTLFLDEISELNIQAQAKLLSVIQNQEVRRIGGTETKKVNCRLICASNKDLTKEVEKGSFRQDLLYRINMASFVIPPLRERREDIPLLSNTFLSKANKKFGFNKIFDSLVLNIFMRYPWPGNIRELENTVYSMAVITDGEIVTKNELPESIQEFIAVYDTEDYHQNITDLNLALEQYEAKIIQEVYKKENSSVKLAKALNISQTTAARKIRKYIATESD
ncbi:MAG: sigma-54 interaction domain-containing protein [Anaerovoracaceae bacterium]